MKKNTLKLLFLTLIVIGIGNKIPVFADTTVKYSTNETVISASGIKVVTEVELLSDESIREIHTQSDGYVTESIYYPDGSATETLYENGSVIFSDDYEEGKRTATYNTLKERIKSETNYNQDYYDTLNSGRIGNANGNFTQGNLIVAYEDGTIYYIDSYNDNDTYLSCIYKMDSNGTNITQITEYSNTHYSNLNVLDGYIYYSDSENKELCKMKTDGTDKEVIYNGHVGRMIVYDKYIYFESLDDEKIYRIKTDGSEIEELASNTGLGLSFMNIEGQYIYYDFYSMKSVMIGNYVNKCRMNLDGTNKISRETKKIYQLNSQVYNNSIYDIQNYRVNKLDENNQRTIINIPEHYDEVKMFNIYDGWIYYVKQPSRYNLGSEFVYKCRLDGSNETLLYTAEAPSEKYQGIGEKIKNISIAGDWLAIDTTNRNREYLGSKRMFIKIDGSKIIPFENSMKTNGHGSGWVKVRSNWYYYNEEGTKKTDWFQDTDGKWYYFDEDGVMAKSQFIGRDYLGENGVWNYTR